MFETIQTLIQWGGVLVVVMLVLLALPRSKLRDVLMPVVGWCFALFCSIYIVSPVDVLPEIALGPFGLVDDVGALVAGILSARAAMRAGEPVRR